MKAVIQILAGCVLALLSYLIMDNLGYGNSFGAGLVCATGYFVGCSIAYVVIKIREIE